MSQQSEQLFTPIYMKPRDDTPWPKDPVFYMLTGSGLFLCRNNPFFTSSVPAPGWPTELSKHKARLELKYPTLSRELMETVVGYFAQVADKYGSEAALLLAWNQEKKLVELLVPDQTVEVYAGGRVCSGHVEYELESIEQTPNLIIIGDAHSHVNGPAFSSCIDKDDELHRAGLHVIVGRIKNEPPEIRIEAVVDGKRFSVTNEFVMEGYSSRNTDIPQEWIDKIKLVEVKPPVSTWRGFGKQCAYDRRASSMSLRYPHV